MNDVKKTDIIVKDLEMASVIGTHTHEQIFAFCQRLNIYVEESWEKDVLALVLRDALIERPELLLFVYQKEIIYFLLSIWESKEMDMETSDWAIIHQLKLLGLVDYFTKSWGNDIIYVVKEAKEIFYFYLKSKTTKRLLKKYDEWQSILYGMMSYYGIISFQRLYLLFCKQFPEPVDDDDLHLFLTARISFMFWGRFAMEGNSNMEYYQKYEVTEPQKTLHESLKNYDMSYYVPDIDELIYVGTNDGIGTWDGVAELADVLLNRMEVEYYRAVTLVKASIMSVQNGESKEQLEAQFFAWCDDALNYADKIKQSLDLLYHSVPVYHLRGWARKELKKKEKKVTEFKIIYGGKTGKGGDDL